MVAGVRVRLREQDQNQRRWAKRSRWVMPGSRLLPAYRAAIAKSGLPDEASRSL
jgi:hypothetical protein